MSAIHSKTVSPICHLNGQNQAQQNLLHYNSFLKFERLNHNLRFTVQNIRGKLWLIYSNSFEKLF